jgi:RHS repeat-associated protein
MTVQNHFAILVWQAGAHPWALGEDDDVERTYEETGLNYYGARYLDPKTSSWLSADPALGEYLPVAPVDDDAQKHNQNLPGMGGVFNTVNLHLYHYAGNNPVKYTDPDGKSPGDSKIAWALDHMAKYGTRMGEGMPVSPEILFNMFVSKTESAGMMGKLYNDQGSSPFICTTFIKELMPLLGLKLENYMPGGQRVVDSINCLKDSLFSTESGKNPVSGVYVFYKKMMMVKQGIWELYTSIKREMQQFCIMGALERDKSQK